jgi:hypothetical protein
LAAGVTVTVRLAPLPPNTMLAFGTSVVLLDEPVTVSAPGSVWASPTVKATAPVLPSSLIVRSAMSEMVGAVLAAPSRRATRCATHFSDEPAVEVLSPVGLALVTSSADLTVGPEPLVCWRM